MALAGIAAEERSARTVDIAGARGDIEEAFAIADTHAGDDTLTLLSECQAEARRLVSDRWAAIEAVAAALGRSGKGWLDEDELRRAADV